MSRLILASSNSIVGLNCGSTRAPWSAVGEWKGRQAGFIESTCTTPRHKALASCSRQCKRVHQDSLCIFPASSSHVLPRQSNVLLTSSTHTPCQPGNSLFTATTRTLNSCFRLQSVHPSVLPFTYFNLQSIEKKKTVIHFPRAAETYASSWKFFSPLACLRSISKNCPDMFLLNQAPPSPHPYFTVADYGSHTRNFVLD